MKAIYQQINRIIVAVLLVIILAIPVQAQDVFGRYLAEKQLYDVKIFYAKDATPGLYRENIFWQASAIRNFHFIKGDGVKEPDLGLSMGISGGYAQYMTDKQRALYTVLQDGILNLTPTLFMRVIPEYKSPFNLFLTAGGGLRVYSRLTNLSATDSPEYKPTDSDSGVFEQWSFDLGAGFDYNRKFSVSYRYTRAWHDVLQSTKQYYQKYINPNSTTFMRSMAIRLNYSFRKPESNFKWTIFTEWIGYFESHDKQSVLHAGTAVTWARFKK